VEWSPFWKLVARLFGEFSAVYRTHRFIAALERFATGSDTDLDLTWYITTWASSSALDFVQLLHSSGSNEEKWEVSVWNLCPGMTYTKWKLKGLIISRINKDNHMDSREWVCFRLFQNAAIWPGKSKKTTKVSSQIVFAVKPRNRTDNFIIIFWSLVVGSQSVSNALICVPCPFASAIGTNLQAGTCGSAFFLVFLPYRQP
jgi:hypothetical protein